MVELEEWSGTGSGTTAKLFARSRCGGFGFCPADEFLGVNIKTSRETDLAFLGVDTQNSHFQFFSHLDDIFGILDLVVGQFRDVQ